MSTSVPHQNGDMNYTSGSERVNEVVFVTAPPYVIAGTVQVSDVSGHLPVNYMIFILLAVKQSDFVVKRRCKICFCVSCR